MTALSEMTWPQVREALDAGHRTVLFAAGSTEQHGRHLPLATDTMLGDALADRVCERLPGVLRGPTLPFGVSGHHMGFPGTITLTPETFKAIVREYVDSLSSHGFDTVLVIPSHGGNFKPLHDLHTETSGTIGTARFIPYTDLTRFGSATGDIGISDGIPPEVSGSHAGEKETSIMLALDPAKVTMAKAVAGYDQPLDQNVAAVLFTSGTKALSDVGVLGDPTPATAERGRRYLDALVDMLAAHFRHELGTNR